MSWVSVALFLLSLTLANAYQGGYLYQANVKFVNITSFDNRYMTVEDGYITFNQMITPSSPLQVLYFFARESDHYRFDQMERRMEFCFLLNGVSSKATEPIFHFNIPTALGLEDEECPVTISKRPLNYDFFPKVFRTNRFISCNIQNFFFDVFYMGEKLPMLTIWVQLSVDYDSSACN